MVADSTQVRVKYLFDEAAERPRDERAAFLDSACGADLAIRLEVERLLAALADAPGFLERAPDTTGCDHDIDDDPSGADPDLVGKSIGGYRLRRVIAIGGMGAVYEAVQAKPHRTVAVKVLRRGIASCSAMRRFEHESQILARLRHPGIAQVYEAGTWEAEGDVPYFVMEYVPDAQSITEYARQHALTTTQRLELFEQVCIAVHHGHQRGIIHRDLKPANILIDAFGAPKIIDFGVARTTDSDIAVTLQTDVGQLIGTLQYMSPEQCQADPDDLDTRSDVYALGAVLYELLCEQLPYDVGHAAPAEALRVVEEEAPAKPSSINRTLRGDVETILLKTLEKERDRRYTSAMGLARDIARYLHHEPIVARPPSAAYQMRKFVQRQKGLAIGIAVALVVLFVASIVGTSHYVQARSAGTDAAEQREELQRRAVIAEAVNEFLAENLLAAASPGEQGRAVTMHEMLETASERIEGAFPGEPLVEAAVRQTLGTTYHWLGLYDRAEPHLTTAHRIRRETLGIEHRETLASMHDLARVYYAQDRLDQAERLLVQTQEARKLILGAEHADTLESMNLLADVYREQGRSDEAETLLRETLEIQRRIPDRWRLQPTGE